MSIKNERTVEVIKDLAAKFLTYEGNKSSLITVTSLNMSKDGKRCTIFFTVFPETLQKTALEFAKRKRSEFKKYVQNNSKLGRIPFMDFEIDMGEKNRQKIDELLNG
ncbi:MAG: ribosome-binding factor A [Candidatus Paceibacterota bacterium]